MLVSDLLHSCANERVAEAAIASIGGSFAAQMQAEAELRGVSAGVLASATVRAFAQRASEREWRELVRSLQGEDAPVLRGLEVIMTRATRLGPKPALPPAFMTVGVERAVLR